LFHPTDVLAPRSIPTSTPIPTLPPAILATIIEVGMRFWTPRPEFRRLWRSHWLGPQSCGSSRRRSHNVLGLFGGRRLYGLRSACRSGVAARVGRSARVGGRAVRGGIFGECAHLGGKYSTKAAAGGGKEENGRHAVHGLTMAASVWLSASVGIGAGGALYIYCTWAVVLVVFVLRLGPRMAMMEEFGDDESSYAGGGDTSDWDTDNKEKDRVASYGEDDDIFH